jgi:hypothetical protein
MNTYTKDDLRMIINIIMAALEKKSCAKRACSNLTGKGAASAADNAQDMSH